MYSVLDQKLFDAYNELKCEPIIAIIEPNMYTGKFDWAKCVRPTGTRNYVKVSEQRRDRQSSYLEYFVRRSSTMWSVSTPRSSGLERSSSPGESPLGNIDTNDNVQSDGQTGGGHL